MKKKIIQKAIELFNEKGFFDVSLRDISTSLDVVGSVTYHFKSKKALMESIYRYMLKTLDGLAISGRLFQKKGEELEVAAVYMDYMQQFRLPSFRIPSTSFELIRRSVGSTNSRRPRKSTSSKIYSNAGR